MSIGDGKRLDPSVFKLDFERMRRGWYSDAYFINVLFESLGVPVDIYGVGSYLMRGENNDFTADIVRVKINGAWHDMAKAGRRAIDNPDLERVT